eukprot:m.28265 g.28265  ORF g.28265 m.28265 type:complete len:149 (+) comp13575_c0_seq1:629-1075(+)
MLEPGHQLPRTVTTPDHDSNQSSPNTAPPSRCTACECTRSASSSAAACSTVVHGASVKAAAARVSPSLASRFTSLDRACVYIEQLEAELRVLRANQATSGCIADGFTSALSGRTLNDHGCGENLREHVARRPNTTALLHLVDAATTDV